MSLPSKRMRPRLGLTRPLMQLSSVDLPAPLGPINATISPSATAIETPRSALIPVYSTKSSETSSIVVFPEIGRDDLRVLDNLLRRPVCNQLSAVQYINVRAQLIHKTNVVFDQKQSYSPF